MDKFIAAFITFIVLFGVYGLFAIHIKREAIERSGYSVEHIVTDIGECDDYSCAIKIGDKFGLSINPVMVGQSVYLNCDRRGCGDYYYSKPEYGVKGGD